MEWSDADGVMHQGTTVPVGEGGAFPSGTIRMQNAGLLTGSSGIDVLIRVSTPHYTGYSPSMFETGYVEPDQPGQVQAMLTDTGYMCLGIGVLNSVCPTGSQPNPDSPLMLSCLDGTPIHVRGAEFEISFVQAGAVLHAHAHALPRADTFVLSC